MRIKIYKKRGKNKEIKQKNGAKHVMSGSLLGVELINKNGEVNNGAHFENVIAQQFYELKEMLGDDCIEVKKGCIVSVSAIFSYSGFAFRFFEIANAIHSCYSSFKAYFL